MTLSQTTATKPAHLSSIPRSYMVEGEKPRLQAYKLSSDLHICHSVHDVIYWVYLQARGGRITSRNVGDPERAIPLKLPTQAWGDTSHSCIDGVPCPLSVNYLRSVCSSPSRDHVQPGLN